MVLDWKYGLMWDWIFNNKKEIGSEVCNDGIEISREGLYLK